jgi:radical SAM superfamily enzyme YgiQ (UPF0313 family)
MKIFLISPSSGVDRETPRGLALSPLALHVLAGLTSPEHEIKIIDEELELADTNEACDVVGISCHTANVSRSYELAGMFRQRGIPVVLGGIHPTVLPEESIQHCDAVVMGEAENVWAGVLGDIEKGKLKRFYKGTYPDLKEFISLKTRKPKLSQAFGVIPVETSRGCPYYCNFCAVPVHYGRKQRHKPVEHVVRDLIESGARKVFFVDDNIMGNPGYAREFLKEIAPLKIKWAAQSSIKVVQKNPDLLRLAKDAGCLGIFFGIESVANSSVKPLKKNIADKQGLIDAIKMVRDSGICFISGMIFGFDEDTEAVFDEALEFVYKNKIFFPTFSYLMPYPGTDLFTQLSKEKRILSTNWDDYNVNWGRVVFKPKNFSAEKLHEETLRVKIESTKLSSILGKLPSQTSHAVYYMILNYGYHLQAKEVQKHNVKIGLKNIVIPGTF